MTLSRDDLGGAWPPQSDTDAQGGLESVSRSERVASLTGIRAVAALLVMGTHAAYTTGKYPQGYWGSFYSRMEIGVPIFFVLSGFLLFGPWVRALAEDRPPPSVRPLRVAPGAPHHAGLRDHGARRVRDVPLPHRGPESRPLVDAACCAT